MLTKGHPIAGNDYYMPNDPPGTGQTLVRVLNVLWARGALNYRTLGHKICRHGFTSIADAQASWSHARDFCTGKE